MGAVRGAALALCLWSLIAPSLAMDNTFCWKEGECILKGEVHAVCAPLTSQTACAGSDHCMWQEQDSLLDLNGDMSPSDLAKVLWPAQFNLSLAERACSDASSNDTCPTTCHDYLAQLGNRVVGEAVAAACNLSTCDAEGVCWDTDAQASFKAMFHTIATTCTGQDFPSCWPSGGRCAAVDVCEGLDESTCAGATLEEGGSLVCNYTTMLRCSEAPSRPGTSPPNGGSPGGEGGDPCQYSQDPCCRRADSFTTCVIDSPPEDSCYFYSNGCQTDYGLCSRQADSNSCNSLSQSGCSWVDTSSGGMPYPTSPLPQSPGNPAGTPTSPRPEWPTSPNGTSGSWPTSPVPNPDVPHGSAHWEIWNIPELPPGYFTNDTDRWWNRPEDGGHGPFDMLTPPIANTLLEAKASGPVCQALTSLLQTMSAGFDGACEVAGLCSDTYLPALYQISSQLEESLYVPLDPCDMCNEMLVDLVPMLVNETGIDLVRLLGAVGAAGMEAFGSACPRMVDGLLWVGKYFDFLPGPAHPVAAAVCPAFQAVVAAAPQLVTDLNRTCELLGEPHDCLDTLTSLLRPHADFEPATAAAKICYAKLPEAFLPPREPEYHQEYPGTEYHPQQQYPSDQEYHPEQYPEYPQGEYPAGGYPEGEYPQGEYPAGDYPQGQYPSEYAPYTAAGVQSGTSPSGYCAMVGRQPECTAPDSASCSTLPGCRWNAYCQQQQCGEQDYWCQQRRASLPVCAPLVKALQPASGDGDAPIPLAEVCKSMSMCTGTSDNSPACGACKTAFSETIASIKYQQQHSYGSGNYGYGYNPQDMAFSQCSSTMSRLTAMKSQCDAYSTIDASAADPAQICQAHASALCQASGSDGSGSSASSPNCGFCTTLLSAYKDLAAAGIFGGSSGLTELCYTTSQWGGSSEDNLRMQLQWRYGCSPSQSSCCAELPADSYLASVLDIRGLTPQSTSECEELPGCTAGAYCWPTWGADACQSLSSPSECQADKQCQWFAWSSDGLQGNCVDAALSAKCRLAGQQDGRSGCLGIKDDQGLSQCSYFQACYQDWSMRQCDDSNACCLKPVELFQPDAPQACSNETSSQAVCDYTTQCQTRYDPCNAYISQSTCELSTTCSWRSMKLQGYPSYGWCSSTRDSCWDYSNDPEACTSAPNCRSVPRCDVSYCQENDQCCLIHSAAECTATPGCATSGWCSLTASDCWQAWDSQSCSAAPGCTWQSYEYTQADGTSASGGWCSVGEDPCSPHYGSPIACAAVRDPRRGTPLCHYQSSCYDACRNCRECMDGVGSFISDVLPSLNGDTTKYAQAIRDFCNQAGGDYWTCFQAYQTAVAHPEAVTRPASTCKAIGMCSSQCVATLGLLTCSTDGSAEGAIRPAAPPAGVCKTQTGCTTAQSCDTSECTVLSQCDSQTGFDIKSCGGTCVSKCALLDPLLAKLNKGTCQTNEDCTVEGETCTPVVGRTCRQSVCNIGTGAVTTVGCAGFCTSGGAPSLVSATLTGDGRQIVLAFDQDVTTVASSSPTAYFANSTVVKLGSYSQVYPQAEEPKALVVYLGWGATIDIDDALALAASPAIAGRLNGRLVAGGGAVLLQAPEAPEQPVAFVSGPSSVGAGCTFGSAADVVIDASRTPFSAGRPVLYTWQFVGAASQRAALDQLATEASDADSPRLVLPGATVVDLSAGTYTLRVTVENWLGANASADFAFEKVASVLPVVAVIGGSEQEFSVASGIRVQTAIDLSTVCPGRRVTYSWEETSGLLPAGSFSTTKANLAVKGPVTGVTGGSVLTFAFSATLEGAGTTTADLTLTARQSRVMAVLAGPRGDVLDTRTLTFSGSGSLDPDDASNTLAPFRFSWACTATDPATQLSTPCFTDPATAPDMTASQLVISPGLLPAGDSLYTISLTAAKGSGLSTRTDTDTTALRVLAGAAPTGKISRFCPGWSGCTSKQHTPSEPLRLVFALDDPSLLPRTTFSWVSSDLSLATAATTTKQALVIQPFTAAGSPVFVDGAVKTINVTATADGKNATASITVSIARRPSCTATSGTCLTVSPASGPVDVTSFVATAAGFAADSALFYDFGLQLPSGKADLFTRSATDSRFTFAPRVLAEGTHTLFVCARDQTGAQACSTADVDVEPAAQQVTAADITALGDSLDTALASGSTDALVSVVRQLSAATSASSASGATSEEAVAAATEQAENAMGAMESLLSGEGATVEETLGVASAASSLVSSSVELSHALADSAVNVAVSVVDAISDPTSTTTLLQAADLDSPVNIVGACAAILVYEAPSPGARRRLLDAEDNATLAEAALDALTRTFHVASGVQTALLASMVEGEAASVGTGGLVVAAALADLAGLTEAVEYAIGDSGAAVTLLDGFAALANSEDSTLQLMLAHQVDASLLFEVVSTSDATVPTPSARRALLTTAPEVSGAASTTVVSGYVNFTSSLDGIGTVAGQAIDISLPLNDAYDAGMSTMCLRLDSSGYWRSDAITLTSVGSGVAHCALSNLNNQQVVAVQYEAVEGAVPETPAPGSPSPSPASPNPSPSPSPSPSPADDTTEEVTVTVPQVTFTARLTAFTPETFTLTVQQQYIAALQAASPTVDTLIMLTNIRAGSVVVDTIIQFLVSNGNAAAADALAATLSSNPSSLLPANVWGNVTVTSLAQGTVSITISEDLLSAPDNETSSNTTALIAGLVGGIGGAILLAGVAICIWKLRKPKTANRVSVEAEMMDSQPQSPMSPITPSPFLQGAHTAPFAPSAPLA